MPAPRREKQKARPAAKKAPPSRPARPPSKPKSGSSKRPAPSKTAAKPVAKPVSKPVPKSTSAPKAPALPAPELNVPLPGGRRHVLSLSFLREGDEFLARLETDAGHITELKNRSLDQLLTLVAGELEDLLV